MMICPKCHQENPDSNKFCRKCGAPLVCESQVPCKQCGFRNPADSCFCENCGSRLNAQMTPVSEPAQTTTAPKKKTGWILCGVICLAVLVTGGGWLYFSNGSRTADSVSAAEIEKAAIKEEAAYQTLQEQPYFASPEKEETGEKLAKGTEVWATAVYKDSKTEKTWIQTEKGWLLTEDGSGKNLEKAVLSVSDQYPTGTPLTTVKAVDVYPVPSCGSKKNRQIENGESIHLQDVQKNQFGSVWGEISDNEWILLEKDQVASVKAAEKTAKNEEAEKTTIDSMPAPDTGKRAASAVTEAEKPQTTVPSETEHLELNVYGQSKQESNYSGPAVAQAVFNLFGIQKDQKAIASETLIDGVADYKKMGTCLTQTLQRNGVRAVYEGTYLEANRMNAENAKNLSGKIHKNLVDGYPTIVVVYGSDYGIPQSTYALVYGMTAYSDGTSKYCLYVPTEQQAKYYEVSQDALFEQMENAGFLCWLS